MVDAAGVHVEVRSERIHAHDRTLDVPSRRAATPRRFPLHQPLAVIAERAPQAEVGGVPLALDLLDALTRRAQARRVEPGQLAVAPLLRRVEVEAGWQQVREA